MAKKKRRLKPGVKLVALCLITAALLTATFLVSTRYSLKKIAESVTYNAKGSFDFSVCYLENDYISEKCFSDTRGFINSLIEEMKVNYKYILKLSRPAEDIKYTYKIVAQTIATEKNDESRILYSETETLFEETKQINNYSLILIDKEIPVDFQKYNKLITDFKKELVLSMDSHLILTASIDVAGSHPHLEAPITNHRESKVIVPLGEQTVDIETENPSFSLADTVVRYDRMPIYSKEALITLVVYILDIITLGLWVYCFILFNSFNKSFDAKINRLLKQYDRAIVKIENLPELDGLKIIRVSSFEELLDVRDNLNKPILYQGRNLSAKFLVINEIEVYLYETEAYSQDEK